MKSGNLIPSRMKKIGVLLPDEVPVAVLGVELEREAARIAHRVRRAARAGDGREAHEDARVRLPTLEKSFILVQRGDVGVRHLEVTIGARAHGVHDALRDPLAVEAGELLEEVVVLEERRPRGAGGLRVLVVGDRRAALGREEIASS